MVLGRLTPTSCCESARVVGGTNRLAMNEPAGAGLPSGTAYLNKLYFRMYQSAFAPSRQVIFLPCANVRPA